jgi:hypothetical protein
MRAEFAGKILANGKTTNVLSQTADGSDEPTVYWKRVTAGATPGRSQGSNQFLWEIALPALS